MRLSSRKLKPDNRIKLGKVTILPNTSYSNFNLNLIFFPEVFTSPSNSCVYNQSTHSLISSSEWSVLCIFIYIYILLNLFSVAYMHVCRTDHLGLDRLSRRLSLKKTNSPPLSSHWCLWLFSKWPCGSSIGGEGWERARSDSGNQWGASLGLAGDLGQGEPRGIYGAR